MWRGLCESSLHWDRDESPIPLFFFMAFALFLFWENKSDLMKLIILFSDLVSS